MGGTVVKWRVCANLKGVTKYIHTYIDTYIKGGDHHLALVLCDQAGMWVQCCWIFLILPRRNWKFRLLYEISAFLINSGEKSIHLHGPSTTYLQATFKASDRSCFLLISVASSREEVKQIHWGLSGFACSQVSKESVHSQTCAP